MNCSVAPNKFVREDPMDKAMRNYASYKNRGVPVPAWLQKQVDAIMVMETDSVRGMAMFIDGLQDERDYLDELMEKI